MMIMPIKKFYYVEYTFLHKFNPLGFHEDASESHRQELYIDNYNCEIEKAVKEIQNDLNIENLLY